MHEKIYNLSLPSHRTSLCNYVNSLDGLVRVKIKRAHRGRSLSQNSWYWGIVLPTIRDGLEEAWGERLTVEEVHEFLKARFLTKPVVNRETGEKMGDRAGSTAKLNVSEMIEYLEECIRFAGEYLGCRIPSPITQGAV